MNPPRDARLRIGLTGGIGSGKSTVAARLVALGATLVDTDAIAHALTGPDGAAIEALRGAFGDRAIGPTGALDRAWMRERAFADSQVRQRLEAILHPLIGREAQREADAAVGRAIVFDVPLLVESKTWCSRVDRVFVIDCPRAVQIERVLRRPGWTLEAVLRVIERQATREARRAAADAVIDNGVEQSLPSLFAEVDALWQLWQPA